MNVYLHKNLVSSLSLFDQDKEDVFLFIIDVDINLVFLKINSQFSNLE